MAEIYKKGKPSKNISDTVDTTTDEAPKDNFPTSTMNTGSSAGKQGASTNDADFSKRTTTKGSSSTTEPPNTQGVFETSSANYNKFYSANKLTQGANTGLITSANQNLSETSIATKETSKAQTVELGVKPSASYIQAVWSNAPASSYAYLVTNYGVDVASRVSSSSPQQTLQPATLANSSFLSSRKPTIRQADERRNKFVDNNLFKAHPVHKASAPIPTKVYRKTNLFMQANQDNNPLAILEGDKFINPKTQFLPQINQEIAPRPEFKAFTSTIYSGVKKTSPMDDTSDLTSNRKSWRDYWSDISTSKYFPVYVGGTIMLILIILIRRKR